MIFCTFTEQLRNQNAQNPKRKMSCGPCACAKNSRMSSCGWYPVWLGEHCVRRPSHPLPRHSQRKGCLRRGSRPYGLRHERCEEVAWKELYRRVIVKHPIVTAGFCSQTMLRIHVIERLRREYHPWSRGHRETTFNASIRRSQLWFGCANERLSSIKTKQFGSTF